MGESFLVFISNLNSKTIWFECPVKYRNKIKKRNKCVHCYIIHAFELKQRQVCVELSRVCEIFWHLFIKKKQRRKKKKKITFKKKPPIQ